MTGSDDHGDDHSDQQRRDQRRHQLDEVNRVTAEAAMAHSMTDEESYEAMLNIELENIAEDVAQRLEKLPDQDPVGYGFFGDRPQWIDRQL